jgi:hypothetical protein
MNIALLFMLFTRVPAVYHAMLTAPNIALESAMACRVFRGVKLGVINGDSTAKGTILGSSQASRPAALAPASEYALDARGLKNSLVGPIAIPIKTTDSNDTAGTKADQVDGKQWGNDKSEVIFDRV